MTTRQAEQINPETVKPSPPRQATTSGRPRIRATTTRHRAVQASWTATSPPWRRPPGSVRPARSPAR